MVDQGATGGRTNQRLRTRKDLLSAAARLLRQGRAPTMEDVADEAMVSRATAYRYFPSVEALVVEAPLDGLTPEPSELFGEDGRAGLVEAGGASVGEVAAARAARAEAALHEMTYRNDRALRAMLAASLTRARADEGGTGVPVRQNRRTALIEAALAPARDAMEDGAYRDLCAALAMIFGPESMVVFEDVLGLEEASARRVKEWAVRALVRAAMERGGTAEHGSAARERRGSGDPTPPPSDSRSLV